jgi:hypothetical protein
MIDRSSAALLWKMSELGLAVPQVMAHRFARIATAGPVPSARDRREFERMGSEKGEAFMASWSSMAAQAVIEYQRIAASLLAAFWSPTSRNSADALTRQIQGSAVAILGKAVTPVHKTAVANAKRLRRTR